jgi:hypothetical protein
MVRPKQSIQSAGNRIAYQEKEFDQNIDEGSAIVGDDVLLRASGHRHWDYFSHDEDYDSTKEDGSPVRHDSVDDEREGLEHDSIAHQESGEEEMVITDDCQDALRHLFIVLVTALLHHLQLQDTERVEADGHAGAEAAR